MALTKGIVVDSIEVLEMGQIQVRTAIKVFEDGKELSKSYHRNTLAPEDSLDGQDARVVAIANATWTPDVIAKYKTMIEKTVLPDPIESN